jgi:hypothetical protein
MVRSLQFTRGTDASQNAAAQCELMPESEHFHLPGCTAPVKQDDRAANMAVHTRVGENRSEKGQLTLHLSDRGFAGIARTSALVRRHNFRYNA